MPNEITSDLKHILRPSISELSNQIQKNNTQTNTTAAYTILSIENEALEHIESLILNLLNYILTNNQQLTAQQVLNLNEIEGIIHKILPKSLSDNACSKARNILKTYQQITKRTNLTFKNISNLQPSQQLLVYRVEDFLKLLKIQYKLLKLNNQLNTIVYLISILEFITKDILRLSCGYVRNLGKFSITKRDVCIAIYADHMLTELFYTSNSAINGYDDTENDDLRTICKNFNEYTNDTSDNSDQTINNDDLNEDLFKKIYFLKIKEFIFELNQHVYDLNLIRKLFRYYLEKCESTEIDMDLLFGNIDELYECSLHLLDLFDDLMSSIDENSILNTSNSSPNNTDLLINLNNNSGSLQQNTNSIMVGHIFWEFAEGAEFDVYKKYTQNLQLDLIQQNLNKMFTIQHVNTYLNDILKKFTDIYKYLLPKLLQSPIYYLNYLYETVEYLIEINEYYNDNEEENEDLDLLQQTLDTLKPIKFLLNELSLLKKYPQRPIETSIRMLPYNYANYDDLLIKNNKFIIKLLQKTFYYKFNKQTERKFKELELNTENFKQKANFSSNENLNEQTPKFNFTYLFKRTNIYLYDTSIFICKTNQRIQKPSQSNQQLKEFIMNQSKFYKFNERHIYLFDGILIVLKVLTQNPIQTQQSNQLSIIQSQSQQQQITQLSGQQQFKFKFKHDLNLTKCYLHDRVDDSCAFELEFFFNQYESEFYLFICKNEYEKEHLMSLLCYTQYKISLDHQLQTLIEQLNCLNPLPIPPTNYRFDSIDTPEYILFDTSNQHSSYTDGPTIKAATIEKLVERLTHHLYLYTNFSRVFLMCYREFCTPIEFFNLLIERFNVPDLNLNYSDLNSIELQKRYKREYQQPIKLKVINVFKHWIDGYFYDFAKSDELMVKLKDFIERLGKTNRRYQDVLLKNLVKKIQTTPITRSMSNSATQSAIGSLTNIPSSSSVHSMGNDMGLLSFDNLNLIMYPQFETFLEDSHGYDILTVHPLEFARQATLMESEIYKDIEPNELISLGWTKSNQSKYDLSPNVCKLINLSNKFTYWYAKCIVDTWNFDERCAVMQRILEIATYFNEMNNFSGLKEIYAALETSSVRRLQATRTKINLESQQMYHTFVKLFDNHDNGYFERLKKTNSPCIPFIGTHLTIILKTYEFNKIYDDKQKQHIQQLQQQAKNSNLSETSTHIVADTEISSDTTTTQNTSDSKNLINFSKYRLLVDFVTDLLQYQNIPYKYRAHEKMRSFIYQEIDNYYEKAAAQLTETNIFGVSMNDMVCSEQTALILNQDITNENYIKQNQIQLIENWLYSKSKQIEPEQHKYPRLRKYTLQSPKCTKQPTFIRQQSFDSQSINKCTLSQVPPILNSLPTNSNDHVVTYQRKIPRKQLSIDATSFMTEQSTLTIDSVSTQKLAKLSLSSADSTPNSPPPNYDDVFQSANHNCFDNLTYFRRIPQPPSQLSTSNTQLNEQRRSIISSITESRTNLTTSQSLSSNNLYENQSIQFNNRLKNSSSIDLTIFDSNTIRKNRFFKQNLVPTLPPTYPPPPPPLPPRKNISSSSSSSSQVSGSIERHENALFLLSPNIFNSNENTSPAVSPKYD